MTFIGVGHLFQGAAMPRVRRYLPLQLSNPRILVGDPGGVHRDMSRNATTRWASSS